MNLVRHNIPVFFELKINDDSILISQQHFRNNLIDIPINEVRLFDAFNGRCNANSKVFEIVGIF